MADFVGIQIGATKEAITAARSAVLDILEARRDEETIRKALEVFEGITAVKGTSITGCTINAPAPTEPEPDDDTF